MRLNYPVELPLDAVGLLWDRVREKTVPLGSLIHAAWTVAGYALGQLLPDGASQANAAIEFEKAMSSGPPDLDLAGPIFQGIFEGNTQAGPSTWMLLLRIALWVIANSR